MTQHLVVRGDDLVDIDAGARGLPNVLTDGNEDDVTDENGTVILVNLLDNTVDPESGEPTVISAAGVDTNGGTIDVAGSNGGVFTISSDGSAVFDTNGEFSEILFDGEVIFTSVEYVVRDAEGKEDVSTVTVRVDGEGTPSTVSGTVVTIAPGTQSLTFVIDHSFGMYDADASIPVGDTSGEGTGGKVVDAVLLEIAEKVAGLDPLQPVHFVLAGATGANGFTTNAETVADAVHGVGGATLANLFAPVFGQAIGSGIADAADEAVDFKPALQSAAAYMINSQNGFPPEGATNDKIIIVTATDGTVGSGDTPVDATIFNLIDTLESDTGINAEIDVIAVNTSTPDSFDLGLLQLIDTDGIVSQVTDAGPLGLDAIVDPVDQIDTGVVVSVEIAGLVFSVLDGELTDLNDDEDVFEFTLERLPVNPLDGVIVNVSTDDDLDTIDRSFDVTSTLVETDDDTFVFSLLVDPEQLILGG